MKHLKMTPDNMLRHINASCSLGERNRIGISTVRDEIKGCKGELFMIEGWKNPFILEFVSSNVTLDEACSRWYASEGFSNRYEMEETLKKIYPDSRKFYLHIFRECFDSEDEDD